MGVHPLTLGWNPNVSFSKLSITGEVDGFPVTVEFTEPDFATLDEQTQCLSGMDDIEIGVVQLIRDQLLRHGILPATRKSRSEAEPTNSGGETQANTAPTWTCPEHGNKSVYPNTFPGGRGLICKVWQAASEGKPNWTAQAKPGNYNGQERYYCKYREFSR
jgi:hypothetical protein